MPNTLVTNLIEQEKMTSRDLWLDQLSNYTIVDMGILASPVKTKNGTRCRVKAFRLQASQQVIYEGVEVILPGNGITGISVGLEGAACIVFGPYSSSVAVDQRAILGANKPYNTKYLKCMPVGNPGSWKTMMEFDDRGNCSYKTDSSTIRFGRDGSVEFNQQLPEQVIKVAGNGIITWTTPSTYFKRNRDGTYYQYLKGVEPGSFAKLESFKDNKLDIFYTTIAEFVEEDGELTEWEQLLVFNKWSRKETYDYTTGDYHKYIRGTEEGKFQYYESFVANIRDKKWGTLEAITEEDGDELDKWTQLDEIGEDGWRRHEHYDEVVGTSFIKIYDANGNILSSEIFNADGSRSLTNTDANSKVLFTRTIAADGKVDLAIGDNSYTLSITAAGGITETQKANKDVTVDGTTTIYSKGDMVLKSDGNINLESTDAGLIKIGNATKTLFYFLNNLYTQLSSLHTEGSPAAHTAAAWAASFVPTDQALLAQVFTE